MNLPSPSSPTHAPDRGSIIVDVLALIAVCAVAFVTVRAMTTGEAPRVAHSGQSNDLCRSVGEAYLSGSLFGAVEQRIEWRGTDMDCDGGPRPDGRGIRIVFSGAQLVVVLGIDGVIDELPGTERSANITVIDETSGRFFSSGGQERCWAMVSDVAEDTDAYRVTGELYCSGSLPSVADSGSVTLRDFRFSGWLNVDAS